MEENHNSVERAIAEGWWVFALTGLFSLIMGIAILALIKVALILMLWFFASFCVVEAILMGVGAVAARRGSVSRWWCLLAHGIVSALAGIMVFAIPFAAMLSYLPLIVFWGLIRGVLLLVWSAKFHNASPGPWFFNLPGFLSLALALLLVAVGGHGYIVVGWVLGSYAVFFGAALAAQAFYFRAILASTATSVV